MSALAGDFEVRKALEKIEKYQSDDSMEKLTFDYIDSYVYQFYNVVLDYFTIRHLKPIHDFIYKNDDFIVLLREIEPIIRQYFPNEELVLEYVHDPEGCMNQLVIYIQIDFNENSTNNILNNLHKIDEYAHKLTTDNIKGKFLVNVESL
ncbi:MAG: hypothetical protein FWH29_02760 [Methanobrevibacter sp.]|nr:hypothetical protein [Methanobrevibacter sp.]